MVVLAFQAIDDKWISGRRAEDLRDPGRGFDADQLGRNAAISLTLAIGQEVQTPENSMIVDA